MFKKLFGKSSHSSSEGSSKELASTADDFSLEKKNSEDFSKIPLAEKSVYKNNKVKFLLSQETNIFSCYEILELWKKDSKSEIYLHEFQKKLNDLVSSARADEMLQLMSMGKNMNAYIYESMREDVLADRVFFIGMRRQLDALHHEVRSQLAKFSSLEENEHVSSSKKSDVRMLEEPVENAVKDTATDTVIDENQANFYESFQSALGETAETSLEPVGFESTIDKPIVENSEKQFVHESSSSDVLEEERSILDVLVVSLFGSTYAIPSHALLEIINPKDQHFEISQGKIKYLRNGIEHIFCSLSHLLFNTPMALPQAHQVILRLNVNDSLFALYVDAIDSTESIEIRKIASHKKHFLAQGLDQAAELIKVLDVESLYAAAVNQRVLSSAEQLLFEESNAALKTNNVDQTQTFHESLNDVVNEEAEVVNIVSEKTSEKKAIAHGAVSFFDDEDAYSNATGEAVDHKAALAEATNQELNILFINSLSEQHEKFKTFIASSATKIIWKQADLVSRVDSIDELSRYTVIVLDSEQRKTVDMDLLVKIRADRRFRRLPVIVATQLTSDVFKQRAYILGANYVLQKPYTFKQLQDVIEMVALQVTVVDDIHES